jgi:hypothetical protein
MKNLYRTHEIIGAASTPFAFAAVSPAAYVQEQAASDTAQKQGAGFGGLVVSARRTEKRLQQVPVAVTALSAWTLAHLRFLRGNVCSRIEGRNKKQGREHLLGFGINTLQEKS